MTSYELLLLWASERGTGSWDEFREAHDWALEPHGGEQRKRPRPWTTAHALSILGHLEVDWQGGRWAAAPPALTILPRAGAHAVLSGARTQTLVERLNAATSDVGNLFCDRYPQEWGPDACYVTGSDETSIERLAASLGIRYEPCVSERLAELLPPLDTYLDLARSTPPAKGYGVKRFNTTILQFTPTGDDTEPGLYEYGVNWRSELRWLDADGTYYALDRATGIYAELRRTGRSELRYVPENVNGILTVPFRAQLPALHARTAAMCSGLMPPLRDGRWHYANVPSDTATRIAASLGQELNA